MCIRDSYDTEIIYTWVATGLHETHMHLDADEFLTPDRVPLEKAYYSCGQYRHERHTRQQAKCFRDTQCTDDSARRQVLGSDRDGSCRHNAGICALRPKRCWTKGIRN